jgi:clusterin-associated protein 1
MSYRELRNFCEMMRGLGYHRNISIENFRDPNFELVADILYWFAQRYDPKMDISDDIEDEKDRVAFIRQVCQLFASKARIVLNPKKLYEATGYAVKELLKIATMMYKAMQSSENLADEEDMGGTQSMMDFNMSSKLHNLKAARTLATEITESGAKLYDLLGQERELKQSRDKALDFLDSISRNLDTNNEQVYIEKCIGNIIDNQTKKMTEMEDTVKQLKLDEGELLNKLTRRKQELERAEKRLKGIENVKPEYQEEYERLEAELERFYTVYVEKFTNIDYLEHELDMYNLKDSQRRKVQQEVIEKFKGQQKRAEKEEIFSDERDDDDAMFAAGHDQMR